MRGYVGDDAAQVHFRTSGESGPALVLFHESPQASNVFQPALPLLGRTLRAFALDTPGYGMSDPPQQQLEIPGYAELLLQAIDALGIETFAVAGQHTGATIALEVARLAGSRVTHAVLSGVLLDHEERLELLRSWAPDAHVQPDGAHLQALWQKYLVLWEEPPELVHLAVSNIASVYERYNWAYNAVFRHDLEPTLAEVTCQLLLLTAERDMLAHHDAHALRIRPDARQVRLTNGTGQLPWREPEQFAAVVTDFILGDPGRG